MAIRQQQRQAKRVIRTLKTDYPDAQCALRYDTPFQLLIATILSAQCTDQRVNIITAKLFEQYPTAPDLANIRLARLEKLIQSAGFFRSKAKNIKACSQALVKHHGGEVPQTMEELVQLAGVGRKTANVVLGTAFGIPTGVVVDTHVGRISRRLGLTEKVDAVQIERELIDLLPQKEWIDYSHRMIYHGRAVCRARRPLCDECSFLSFCPQVGVE